jgi:hypothetical protein
MAEFQKQKQMEHDGHMSPKMNQQARKLLSKIVKIELYKESNNLEEFDENFKIITSKVGMLTYKDKIS